MSRQPINIVFDGPLNCPGRLSHESPRFVDVENDDGESISAGKWWKGEDGFWRLRITELPWEVEE